MCLAGTFSAPPRSDGGDGIGWLRGSCFVGIPSPREAGRGAGREDPTWTVRLGHDSMRGMDLVGKLDEATAVDGSLSDLARGVVESEILRIAAEIRALKAKGAEICNLTVGDFDPTQFPVPAKLLDGVRDALAAGHTNYPPSDGVPALREAVARFYERRLGL